MSRRRPAAARRHGSRPVLGSLAPAFAVVVLLAVVAGAARPAGAATSGSVRTAVSAAPRTTPAPSPSQGTPVAAPDAAAPTREKTTLKGDAEGTVFKSLTVEGEDRVHVRIARPELRLSLDPEKAPGLSWGSARDVLDRTTPDLMKPMLASTASEPCPYLARPWLSEFATGPVASFAPDLEGVERWRMAVANSKGETVATFGGKGRPPKNITWDGRAQNGTPVSPGLTYSYVFEAYDRAGNKRNFVGPGFTVPAYRIETPDATTLLFAGDKLGDFARARWGGSSAAPRVATPSVLLEAASWLNQSARPTQPIRISVRARSADEAQSMADGIARALKPLVIGDPARVRVEALAQADAPDGGVVSIASSSR